VQWLIPQVIEEEVTAFLGSNDGARVCLNGAVVFSWPSELTGGRGAGAHQNEIPLHLNASENVLIRKHRTIRNSLGISVPVPGDSDGVVDAVFEGLVLREQAGADTQQLLPGLEDFLRPQKEDLHLQWDEAAERERRSRTMFAQESIHVDEIARELDAARAAVGSSADVAAFVLDALRAADATISVERDGSHRIDATGAPPAVRDLFGDRTTAKVRFELPVGDGVRYLARTSPIVEGIAAYVMETALDPQARAIAQRAGAIYTAAVDRRTTLLLVRFRYDITTRREDGERSQLAVARRLVERLEIHHTPKHGSWLNVAECELSVLRRQCLSGRIGSISTLAQKVRRWEADRNHRQCGVQWHFTAADARTKLRRLYPQIQMS